MTCYQSHLLIGVAINIMHLSLSFGFDLAAAAALGYVIVGSASLLPTETLTASAITRYPLHPVMHIIVLFHRV